jgi:hypothetical protein
MFVSEFGVVSVTSVPLWWMFPPVGEDLCFTGHDQTPQIDYLPVFLTKCGKHEDRISKLETSTKAQILNDANAARLSLRANRGNFNAGTSRQLSPPPIVVEGKLLAGTYSDSRVLILSRISGKTPGNRHPPTAELSSLGFGFAGFSRQCP